MAEDPSLQQPKLRALVVDDSAYNRQTITAMLESLEGVEVVGRAMNGKEALKLAFDLAPDVITLDLEMPEMDGFSFLRLLMNKRPTPVLVVSGYAQRENVFRALELGALDFLAKPSREVSPDLKTIEHDLLEKIEVVRRLQAIGLRLRGAKALAGPPPPPGDTAARTVSVPRAPSGPAPTCVVAVAASTGGPPALQRIVSALPRDTQMAMLVAQHMPTRFTHAFAERLDRLSEVHVVEAEDGHRLCAGTVYVAPGSGNLEVELVSPHPRVRVVAPRMPPTGPTITPSGDHLFKSLAAHFGSRLCVVVLTGMGSDGRDGAVVAKRMGAHVVAEDPRTAVMPGMPYSVIESGVADEILDLDDIADAISRFVSDSSSRRVPG